MFPRRAIRPRSTHFILNDIIGRAASVGPKRLLGPAQCGTASSGARASLCTSFALRTPTRYYMGGPAVVVTETDCTPAGKGEPETSVKPPLVVSMVYAETLFAKRFAT